MVTTESLANILIKPFCGFKNENVSYIECFALGLPLLTNIWEEHDLEERDQPHGKI